METVVSPINASDQWEFDKLAPEIKQKFRELEMDFIYVLWFQVSQLFNDNDTKIQIYQKYFNKL